jgi:hypothetical protein
MIINHHHISPRPFNCCLPCQPVHAASADIGALLLLLHGVCCMAVLVCCCRGPSAEGQGHDEQDITSASPRHSVSPALRSPRRATGRGAGHGVALCG